MLRINVAYSERGPACTLQAMAREADTGDPSTVLLSARGAGAMGAPGDYRMKLGDRRS